MSSLSVNNNHPELGGQTAPTDKLNHGEFLFNGFSELFNTYDVLAEIHRGFGNDQKLRILCYQLSEYPSLMDAFKAAAESHPDFIEKALFCSWFCFLIAGQLKLPVSATKDLFIAGLVQDIAASGRAHLKKLSPIFSDEAGSLNSEANDDNHPVITGRFLDTIPRLSPGIKPIIRTHHERFDGSGFPDGKVEQGLSTAQQILIVSNEVSDLCHRGVEQNYNFVSILPILKLNASVYFRPVFSAVINVIRPSVSGTTNRSVRNTASIIESQRQLNKRWPHVLTATSELALLNETLVVITSKQIARRAWMLVTTAGILSDALDQWLSTLGEDQAQQENDVLFELTVLLDELEAMIVSFQTHLETLTNDTEVKMSDTQRSLLIDLSYSMGELLETFDLDEFTILNMCD
ncbi:HD-GYP domain-containing protein [Alkalimarinus alittae]|uniref:HD-GYP domain-containing protein n=1 Tax=Alkalimarinus alittae TaxID=2961619 RepID=A0ABY6MYH9_9ALTE|nr:HD domain-containing phosphohydrolase [Alkalimarinus alittae]UZE94822.1 hypothetical protein NKI27_12115 [Alkalimarinus alittae]